MRPVAIIKRLTYLLATLAILAGLPASAMTVEKWAALDQNLEDAAVVPEFRQTSWYVMGAVNATRLVCETPTGTPLSRRKVDEVVAMVRSSARELVRQGKKQVSIETVLYLVVQELGGQCPLREPLVKG